MTIDRDLIDRQAKIRDRAYAIWESEGRPNGQHLECLQRAEHQIEAGERGSEGYALPGRDIGREDATADPHRWWGARANQRSER
jgi:Protein of unknown function (DUF2934)